MKLQSIGRLAATCLRKRWVMSSVAVTSVLALLVPYASGIVSTSEPVPQSEVKRISFEEGEYRVQAMALPAGFSGQAELKIDVPRGAFTAQVLAFDAEGDPVSQSVLKLENTFRGSANASPRPWPSPKWPPAGWPKATPALDEASASIQAQIQANPVLKDTSSSPDKVANEIAKLSSAQKRDSRVDREVEGLVKRLEKSSVTFVDEVSGGAIAINPQAGIYGVEASSARKIKIEIKLIIIIRFAKPGTPKRLFDESGGESVINRAINSLAGNETFALFSSPNGPAVAGFTAPCFAALSAKCIRCKAIVANNRWIFRAAINLVAGWLATGMTVLCAWLGVSPDTAIMVLNMVRTKTIAWVNSSIAPMTICQWLRRC